jgi:hypothetical protein
MDAAAGTPLAPAALGRSRRPTQHWVLSPLQDGLFIVAAPALALGAALLAFGWLGAAAATSLILLTHVVFTVAHHLPTFIRVYGDVELFRRYRWSFLLAPVVPLAFAGAALAWINARGLPLDTFLYLYIMLALWDPWHFLRQHYGFMRIYDRHNAAPRKLAARMDLALTVAWFVFVMLASGEWLAGMLEELNTRVQVPLALTLPLGLLPQLTALAQDAAFLTTAAYAVYLVMCVRRGWHVSLAKITLAAVTFGVMFVSYAPNAWMAGIAPGWTFKVGFAVIGIVHMTQYLAIVWRYNRGLAANQRARRGWFAALHARGGWLIAAVYVAVCLGYGAVVTQVHDDRWIMSVALALGFTSTLLHYYFDGFIWKVRHAQNRDSLGLGASGEGDSWWRSARAAPTAGGVALRQLAYFGVPMALLTAGALNAADAPAPNYIGHMYSAERASRDGDVAASIEEARRAFAAMESQLPFVERMAAIAPTAAREAAFGFLLYNHSYYANVVMPALDGQPGDPARRRAHALAAARAAGALESALSRGGPLEHAGRPALSREAATRALESWRRVAGAAQ